MIAAFDPGRNIGLAFLSEEGELLESQIVGLVDLARLELSGMTLVLGNGTGSSEVKSELGHLGHQVTLVDETGTTLEGRQLYYRDHPPSGLWRFVPRGLRPYPELLDHYAAYAIGLRYLAQKKTGA